MYLLLTSPDPSKSPLVLYMIGLTLVLNSRIVQNDVAYNHSFMWCG